MKGVSCFIQLPFIFNSRLYKTILYTIVVTAGYKLTTAKKVSSFTPIKMYYKYLFIYIIFYSMYIRNL